MMRLPRIVLSLVLLSVAINLAAAAEDEIVEPAQAQSGGDGVQWYDVRTVRMEGQGWTETAAPFDRFPARAEGIVRDAVWNLSRHSAGICARFVSDATSLSARWTLTSAKLEMAHMPATGVSGVDLYVRDDEGAWRWLANGRPSGQSTTAKLFDGIPEGRREYRLYFPLYNGVTSVELGLPTGATLWKPEAMGDPIVFYGTSITQGGCASRPGMVHTAILGRRLERPVINLGFSGNGRMEIEVAQLMAELPAAAYVIDCLPNIGAAEVAERTEPLVKLLRDARPDVPIILVEDRTYSDAFLNRSKRERNDTSRVALREAYDRLRRGGVQGLYYLAGEDMLGQDNEGTVDSSHPTDLGFMRQADAFEPVLREALPRRGRRR